MSMVGEIKVLGSVDDIHRAIRMLRWKSSPVCPFDWTIRVLTEEEKKHFEQGEAPRRATRTE